MILKCKRKLLGGIILAFVVAVAGCDGSGGSAELPEIGPEAVTKQFYEYISEAKLRGGTTPAKEAFKLIDSDSAHMNIHQFVQIVKKYPQGFMVDVGKAKINGTQAVVAISYKMRSSFGDTYTVQGELPLNVDQASRTWKVDFTGDTYGMQKDEFLASKPETSQ